MRVIAGVAKGRRLKAPRGATTRPMTDRVREALFSSLGALVEGARVLDLYAGSGSLGIEALSRGAGSAVFVESDRTAQAALADNLAATGLDGEVVGGDVADYLKGAAGPFDLAFVDPPFALSLASLQKVLEDLVAVLAPGAIVVLHRPSGEEEPAWPAGLHYQQHRRYGDSAVWRLNKEM